MITLDVQRRDFGYASSPLAVSFIRMYGSRLAGGESQWAMCIGRDTGILYQTTSDGRTIQFPLSPDAWCFNLQWSRAPHQFVHPDPCLFLTEKPLIQIATRSRYANTPIEP